MWYIILNVDLTTVNGYLIEIYKEVLEYKRSRAEIIIYFSDKFKVTN